MAKRSEDLLFFQLALKTYTHAQAIVDLLVLEIGKKVQVLEYHKEFDETLEV